MAPARGLSRRATMKNAIAGLVTAFSMSALAAATPARAGSGDVAAGLIGGFAAGAILGPAPAPPPAPVHVAPGAVYLGETPCHLASRRTMWAGRPSVPPPIHGCHLAI